MTGPAAALHDRAEVAGLDTADILEAVAEPVFAVDRRGHFAFLNPSAEQFFQGSRSSLIDRAIAEQLPPDSALLALIERARSGAHSVSDTGLMVEGPKIGEHLVAASAAPVGGDLDHVVVSLKVQSIARKIDDQLVHRGAARSVTAMAAMLAHEVKNPLSGIRGAAQLLERSLPTADRELSQLICEETDRIAALVDRMEMFSDHQPINRAAINIHEILDHVRRLAVAGFGRHVAFEERYDPSLPNVYGNRDLLIQAVLNLVKNAAEAVPEPGGLVRLGTRYEQGIKLSVQGSDDRLHLPLTVVIQDNGPGIPADLQRHLFEPFVSTKPHGKGLGLALVAKIIGDHGGIIEYESTARRTEFRLRLPAAPADAEATDADPRQDGGTVSKAAQRSDAGA